MRSWLTAALVLLTLATSAAADGPTREDFHRELLTAGPTPLTSEFNAYYEDAFSVDKLDLLESLPAFAREAGREVRAIVVIGPLGPLWTYHVITFWGPGEPVRCNSLVMPHARITGKSTGELSEQEVGNFLLRLFESPLLSDRGHTRATISSQLPANDLGDFRFDMMVADFKASPPTVRIGEISRASDREAGEKLFEVVNSRLRQLRTTYEPGNAPKKDKQ